MGELAVPQRTLAIARTIAADLQVRGRPGQLIVHKTNYARAYVYAGEWVADCPRGCGNVEFITEKNPRHRSALHYVAGEPHTSFRCSYCQYHTASIHWPADGEQIMDVLSRRPIPHTRNWYPEGHITAVRHGIPDGQTVEELVAENVENGVC